MTPRKEYRNGEAMNWNARVIWYEDYSGGIRLKFERPTGITFANFTERADANQAWDNFKREFPFIKRGAAVKPTS